MPEVINSLFLREKLQEFFGYHAFRGAQEAIILNLLQGENTFVIMPTGAGKSLCYQLPALVQEGTAIVISPLIALMKNQVDQLNALGVQAYFLNSTLSKAEANRVKQETLAGNTKLLYVAPETLNKEENIKFFKRCNLSFVAIDEAHCISEWGHDFRPEYRKIRNVAEEIGPLPLIALTATATPKVQQDIQKNLQMEDATVFKTSFNRDNLYYMVRPKSGQVNKELIKFVRKHKGRSGIIYCLSRRRVEEIAELLQVNDINALPYHAGMDGSQRMRNQDAFLSEDVDVVVATIAFGMGIDKPDVRFVIHYDAPKSLEGYYQETGRAGRDGIASDCLMFYSYADVLKLDKFNKDKPVMERENARHLLQEMADYSESGFCRRRQLLHYFGEYMAKDCGYCDNCKSNRQHVEGKNFVKMAVEVTLATQQKQKVPHLCGILMGDETDEYISSYGHAELDLFGKGKDKDLEFWKSVFRQANLYGYLEKDIAHIGVLRVSKKGMDFLEKPESVKIWQRHDYEHEAEEEMDDSPRRAAGHDEALYDLLKKLRKKIANQKDLPPYVIFQDPSMVEMATIYPTTKEELASINGVGQGKVRKFGKPFLDAIAKYVDENDITTAADVQVKSTANKSKVKIFIIQQIDRKMDLDEIAKAKGLSFHELLEEIEHICFSGTKLSLNYYIDQVIDEGKQEDLYDYFMEADTDSLEAALEEFEDDEISEEDIRLMRVKFMSEHAM